MRKTIALVLFLLAAPLAAETVVICGTIQPVVPTRVVFYAASVHGPAFPSALIDPDLSAVLAFPWSEWKCSGQNVVRMTAQERTDIAVLEAAEALEAAQEGAKAQYDAEIMVRALASAVLEITNKQSLALLDAFNAHRTVGAAAGHNLAAITEAQVKTAILARTGQIFSEAEFRTLLQSKADALADAGRLDLFATPTEDGLDLAGGSQE